MEFSSLAAIVFVMSFVTDEMLESACDGRERLQQSTEHAVFSDIRIANARAAVQDAEKCQEFQCSPIVDLSSLKAIKREYGARSQFNARMFAAAYV